MVGKENTEIFCSKFCKFCSKMEFLQRCQQDPSSQYGPPLRDLPSKISSPQIQLGALEKPNKPNGGDLWRSLECLKKPSTAISAISYGFHMFSLSSWETMGNWDHRFVVSNIEVLLKYYWSIIEVMFIHGLMVPSDSHISHICSRVFSDGNLGGGRDVQRDPGWGRAFLWFSRQDLVTRCYSLMSSWCVRVVFIFVCLHPLQDVCFVTLHAAHTAHAAHAMNIKNKMKPTNPNAHTYVNGTDVKTHGYAVTHNTFLQ